MGKQMVYTDDAGNEYPNSYWRLVQHNIGYADRSMVAQFYGYRTEADRRAGKRSIGQKSYNVSGDRFDSILAAYDAMDPKPDIRAYAYQLASQFKDEPAPTPEDKDNKVSFFEGATDLT